MLVCDVGARWRVRWGCGGCGGWEGRTSGYIKMRASLPAGMQRVGRTAKSECTQYFSPEIVKKGPTENKAQVRARLHDNPLLPLLSEVELPTFSLCPADACLFTKHSAIQASVSRPRPRARLSWSRSLYSRCAASPLHPTHQSFLSPVSLFFHPNFPS